MAAPRARRNGPITLAIDIGGTGLKASLLDAKGAMLSDRVRVETTYPCPPQLMVDMLADLTAPLGAFDRVSAAFPGVVRNGLALSAPHFITKHGPGSAPDKKLVAAWHQFDLAGALATRLGKPCRVINDADLQGLDVVQGHGVELVITLGTGMGNAVFEDGRLGPRLELSHHPLFDDVTYNDYIGDAARKRIGNKKWNRRVARTIKVLDALFFFDHLYIGGGNAARLTIELGPNASIIDANAGILGGIRLWDTNHVTT
jgi:polyphosphate glucokinase